MPSKHHARLMVVSFALLLALASNPAPASVTPALAADTPCDTNRSIQVSGSAMIKVVPDLVTLQLGVTSTDFTPQGVYDKNTATTKKVMAAIRQLGVTDKDLSTDYYIIQPVYNDYDALTIKGYRINNTIAVNLKDVSKVSQVLTAALSAGANEVIEVQFKTSQLRPYRDQARGLALTAAQEKAQALTSAAGTQVGCVLSIDETSGSAYYGGGWGGRNQALTQNVMQNAPSSDQPLIDDGPISLGQIAVQAEVQVRFSLK